MTLAGSESSFNSKPHRPRRSSTSATKTFFGKPLYRTQSLQKAFEKLRVMKVRFYRNGDRFYQGLVYVVSTARFRTFESLLADLTTRLADKASLPQGVRYVFTTDGSKKINSLDDLVEGGSYVCASLDAFKRVDYGGRTNPDWCVNVRAASSASIGLNKQQVNRTFQLQDGQMRSCTSHEALNRSLNVRSSMSNQSVNEFDREAIRPRLVFIIRSGIKPRKSIRLLLNKKTCHSLEQVFNDITEAIRLDSGAVRKVFGLSGKQVLCLQDFFCEDSIFIAYGNHEKPSHQDFVVASEEARTIRPYSQSNDRSKRVVLQRKHSNSVSATKKRPVSMPTASVLRHHKNTSNKPFISPKTSDDHQFDSKWPLEVAELFDIREIIGDGTYAEVRMCFERATGNKYALKVVDRSKYNGKESLAVNEVNLLRSIRHRNIIRLVKDLQTSHDIYMILEYANGGDLFETISSGDYSFSEQDASLYLYDILQALLYLHDRSIVHRDVKPENLLISESINGKKSLKLADFGMATTIKGPLYTVCGTPTYVAPEIILQNGYGYEVDIWASGIITYIMLCGYPPFRSAKNNQEELFDAIIANNLRYPTSRWDSVSPSAFRIIEATLVVDPRKRPTARDLLQKSWLSHVRRQHEGLRRTPTYPKTTNDAPILTPSSNIRRNSKKKRVNTNARVLKVHSTSYPYFY